MGKESCSGGRAGYGRYCCYLRRADHGRCNKAFFLSTSSAFSPTVTSAVWSEGGFFPFLVSRRGFLMRLLSIPTLCISGRTGKGEGPGTLRNRNEEEERGPRGNESFLLPEGELQQSGKTRFFSSSHPGGVSKNEIQHSGRAPSSSRAPRDRRRRRLIRLEKEERRKGENKGGDVFVAREEKEICLHSIKRERRGQTSPQRGGSEEGAVQTEDEACV